MRHIEVDDVSNRPATELEVGKHLRRVQREKLFDRLQFDNDAILDEKSILYPASRTTVS